MLTPLAMPSIAELADRAIKHTDFLLEVPPGTTPRELFRAATIATDQAAEAWEEEVGVPIGATVPDHIRFGVATFLVTKADALNIARENDAAAALEDGIAAGDLNPRGEPVPYSAYARA